MATTITNRDVQAILEIVFTELGNRPAPDDEPDIADFWKYETDSDGILANCEVTTYAAGEYLTRDAGLVLRLTDGSEFQITIVQSRLPSTEPR